MRTHANTYTLRHHTHTQTRRQQTSTHTDSTYTHTSMQTTNSHTCTHRHGYTQTHAHTNSYRHTHMVHILCTHTHTCGCVYTCTDAEIVLDIFARLSIFPDDTKCERGLTILTNVTDDWGSWSPVKLDGLVAGCRAGRHWRSRAPPRCSREPSRLCWSTCSRATSSTSPDTVSATQLRNHPRIQHALPHNQHPNF